jgi:hypothetical protein
MAVYVPDYPRFGGAQLDTAVLRNVLTQVGLQNPHTQHPYTEAMIAGLGGGIGFRYTVSSLSDTPPRIHLQTHLHTNLKTLFQRVGAEPTVHLTGSRRRAHAELLSALGSGRPALCLVSSAGLPHHGLPPDTRRPPTQLVAAVGIEGERVFIDDLCERSVPMPTTQLSSARGALRRLQNRLITVDGAGGGDDLRGAICAALGDNIAQMEHPPDNCHGAAGMAAWHRALTRTGHRMGWSRLLDAPPVLLTTLRRCYEGIRSGRSSPGGGRPLYAAFLDEAALILGEPVLHRAAGLYLQSSELWERLADLLLPEEVATLWRCRRLVERRQHLLRAGGEGVAAEQATIWATQEALGRSFQLPGSAADRRFRRRAMALTLEELGAIEARARGVIAAVLSGAREGEGDGEGRLAQLTVGGHLAAVDPTDGADECEAQAGAVLAVGGEEAVEQPREVGLRDAAAGIGDREARLRLFDEGGDLDRRRAVAVGVLQQVQDDGLDLAAVGMHRPRPAAQHGVGVAGDDVFEQPL